MSQVEFIELNEGKAHEWYANQEGLSIDEVGFYPFFNNLQEVFQYVYVDENDSHQDTIDMLNKVSSMDITQIAESGAKTIAEYLALDWERLRATPYGYIAIEI